MSLCADLPRDQRGACRRQQGQDLQRRWLQQLAWSEDRDQLLEVQHWLGIFPVNWRQLPEPQLLLERQIDTLRQHSAGGYPDLLAALVLDPALQISLNGPGSRRGQPNENLARELLELFSLGEGHYTENDVREAARALTGYKLDASKQLVLDPRRHDPTAKTVLGRRADFDGASLALWLADQPATARQITARLWRQTIGSLPPPRRLNALARQWRQQQLSLPWLQAALKSAPEARRSRSEGLRIADPIEMVARSLRLLGSRHPDALRIALAGLNQMGQMPFEPPSVKGWPVNEQWLTLRWWQARRRTLQRLLAHEEVWATRALPPELPASLTPLPPLGLNLPAAATRENLELLFRDPVWQLG